MKNNQLQLVSFDQAKRLKAAGFDWVCDYWYELFGKNHLFSPITPANYNDEEIFVKVASAPTVALALKYIISKYKEEIREKVIEISINLLTDTEDDLSQILDKLLTLIENGK